MFHKEILYLILSAFVAAYLTRVLAFWIFRKKQESANLVFIQKNMPLVIIIILFFYTFYGVDFSVYPYGIDVLTACMFVFGIHFIFRNALLSIVLGTVFYMCLLRFF